jgi:hypothetical protein
MECGCILIGHPSCYQNIGMVPFEHYLPQTSNTLVEIENIITAHKDNTVLLEKISKNAIALEKATLSPTQLYQSISSYC